MDNVRKSVLVAMACRVASIGILLATPPLFLIFKGPKLLGAWLILIALPEAFNLFDMGIPHISGSFMAMQYSRGDKRAYANTFWTALVYSAAILPIVGLIVYALKDPLSQLTVVHSRGLLAAMVTGFIVQAQLGATVGGAIRARGQVVQALLLDTSLRIIELIAVTIALAFGAGLTGCVAAALGSRTLYLTLRVAWLFLDESGRDLRLGSPSWSAFAAILAPASSYALGGFAQLGYIQMPVIILGSTINAAVGAAYSTTRTMTRLGPQVLLPLLDPLRSQFSAAFANQDLDRVRFLFQRSFQLAAWETCGSAVLIGLFGPTIFRIWTVHKIAPDGVLIDILLASGCAYALSMVCLLMLASVSRHSMLSIASFVSTIMGLLVYFFLPHGPRSMAAILLASDLVVMIVAILQVRATISIGLSGMLTTLLLPPLWLMDEAVMMLRRLARPRGRARSSGVMPAEGP